MKIQEAIDILKIHQQWRLGADIEMLEPKKISEAINVIILQFAQKEISDEEILNAAKESKLEDLIISVGSFELGARWYREQLKKRVGYKL
jgi:hypothetical protein